MKKLKFEVNSVLPSLNMVTSVILAKNAMPILGNVLFTTASSDGKLSLSLVASDGDTWITHSVSDGISGDEGISICLDANDILQSLRNLSGYEIELYVDESRHTIECKYGNGKFAMPFIDGGEYPTKNAQIDSAVYVFNAKTIENAIRYVSYAAANDEIRPTLNGLYFSISANEFDVVATDGKCLAIYVDSHTLIKDETCNAFILPRKAANLLRMVAGGTSDHEDILMRNTGEIAAFECGAFKMIARLIDGRYPNYRSILPKEFTSKAVVGKQCLADAIRRVLPLGDSNSKMIKASFDNNTIKLQSECLEMSTEAVETIPCEYDGAPVEIGFSGNSLVDVLKSIEEDSISIKLNAADKPAQFEPEQQFAGIARVTILMPMRI